MLDNLETVADLLRDADSVAILTGAGVSKESGIPTFRDALEGYWATYDPEKLATPEAFERDPELVTRWYDERRMKVRACDPNPAHHALADIEAALRARGRSFLLITQNVDRLHQRAGSEQVVELHGCLDRWRCTKTGESTTDLPAPFEEYPPTSAHGGLLRPGVVWFGEGLPPDAIEAAASAAQMCDLYFAIGTSGVVYPATGLVMDAKRHGAICVECNPDSTPVSEQFEYALRGPAGTVLPELYALAFGQDQ